MDYASPLVKIVASAAIAVSIIISAPITLAQTPKVEEPVPVAATSTPAVAETHKAPAAKNTGTCEKYSSLISSYDWPVDVALQICKDESRGNPLNVNLSSTETHYANAAHTKILCVGSYGLFQVACFWPKQFGYTLASSTEAAVNIQMAYNIWKKQGFSPWSTYHGN